MYHKVSVLFIPGNGFQIIFLFFVLVLVTSIQKQPWVVVLQSGESGPYHTGVGATISASHAMCIQITWAFKKMQILYFSKSGMAPESQHF